MYIMSDLNLNNLSGWQDWEPEQKQRLLDKLKYDFNLWRLPQQEIPPDNEWRYYLNLSGRGGSKCVSVNTPIFTTKGFKLMSEIDVGDILFDENGQQTNVTHISPIMDKESYKITFSDKSVIYADKEHMWVTLTNYDLKKWNRKDRGYDNKGFIPDNWAQKETITTEEILNTLTHSSRRRLNHKIPLSKPLTLSEKKLSVHPYFLGCFIGDGFSSTASICGVDREIFQHLDDLGYPSVIRKPREDNSCLIASFGVDVTRKLKKINVINNKHIPKQYLLASKKQRLELLQGLMDTDGGMHTGTKSEVIFSTVIPKLAEDVEFLVTSLGMKCSVRSYQGRLNGVDKKIIYRVCFPALLPVFKLSRKLKQLNFDHKFSRKNMHRTICSIEPIGVIPVKCIAVDSPNSMYLVGRSLIPTHNTRIASEEIRRRALAVPGTRINLVAPTHSDARDTNIQGESGVLAVCAPGEIKKYLKNNNQIIFNNGSRLLTFSAQEPERLRGKQSHYAFLDEFAAFDDTAEEILQQVQMSNRLGRDPKIYITTTPKPMKILEDLIAQKDTYLEVSSTLNNPFLAVSTIKELVNRYADTALGQQELFGELLTESKDALWNREMIEQNRVTKDQLPKFVRTVIAVDPSRTDNKRSDEAGIIVGAMGIDGNIYILRDLSFKGSPQAWCNRVIQAYHAYNANTIAVERSDGDLVKTLFKNIDNTLPIRMIAHQRKGKMVRAEPAVALMEQGRVKHVGYFKLLENQLCSKVLGDSAPDDRFDAYVYLVKELSTSGKGGQFIPSRGVTPIGPLGSPRQDQLRARRGF